MPKSWRKELIRPPDFLESLDLLFSGDDDSEDSTNGRKEGREWKSIPSPEELADDITENPE